jgi:hypothetical protein
MVARVQIDGIPELRRSLRDLENGAQKELRLVLNEGADMVADEADNRVPVRSGRAAGSVRARSTQTEGRVVGGGSRAPYYPWLDMGGRVGRNKSVRRPYRKSGRYLSPALENKSDDVMRKLADGIEKLIRKHGLGG